MAHRWHDSKRMDRQDGHPVLRLLMSRLSLAPLAALSMVMGLLSVDIQRASAEQDRAAIDWYTKAEPVSGHSVLVHFASGNGGNKIYVVPLLDMVIAITSSAYNRHYGQSRSQEILLKVLSATPIVD
jgi:hypothetical protein